jgi:DNA polymerase III subunit gamma/tau
LRSGIRGWRSEVRTLPLVISTIKLQKALGYNLGTMGQALYRKYRSKTLDEVIGQDHVTKTLKEALRSGRISHAYLFTGPRGVGKTSVARILAHEVNGLKNVGEPAHLDIIEIDAASNRRIDEIRELRERVHVAPAGATYKVYIIDEVHMLTKEAFNALLKTLEEPPKHVIFILATTEGHKLPETIISRTQRFTFKPVSQEVLAEHLKNLAKSERLKVSDEALKLIAQYSEGSVRDSVSLLDQLAASDEKIDEEAVRQVLGVPQKVSIENLLAAIKDSRPADVLTGLDELREQGVNPAIAAKELAYVLRNDLINGVEGAWLTKLLRSLLDVAASDQPEEDLEISLLEAATQSREKTVKPAAAKSTGTKAVTAKALPANKGGSAVSITAFSLEMWPEVLKKLKDSGSPCYSALRLARPQIAEGVIALAFEFSLHQKKVNHVTHKGKIAETIEELCGQRLKIECIVDKVLFPKHKVPAVDAKKSQIANGSDPVEAISNIFGAAEVLES